LYNFLVTGDSDAWDLPAYEYGRERFGEHTSEKIREQYKSLSASEIEELKSFPALFAYEREIGNVRVGYIRNIRERRKTVSIEYEFEKGIPEIPFSKIVDLKDKLDIDKWEMNRTHWAVKDEDLFSILSSAGLIDDSFTNLTGQLGRVQELRFKVALSFSGDHRDYVFETATELKRQLPRGSVFYDNDFKAQLALPNLDVLLQNIYLKNSDLVVVFLSAEYEKRSWCGLEWRAVRDIIKNRNDQSVMLLRFDDTPIPGLFSHDGYIDLNHHSPAEAASFVMERVRLNEAD
jgi:hypothetical protein